MYKDINIKELKEELYYEEDTGNFFWLTSGNGRHLGNPIGYKSLSPYLSITFQGNVLRANRLAWFYMTGEWPSEGMVVDHEDGNPRNNRWKNLRLATSVENAANRRRRQQTLSGAKGVHLDPISKLWNVQIVYNGTKHLFGPFEQVATAHKVHEKESKRIREEFHRPTELRQQKATFSNREVIQAVEEFIKDKVLVGGRYIRKE
jgi:HNH endonuclease